MNKSVCVREQGHHSYSAIWNEGRIINTSNTVHTIFVARQKKFFLKKEKEKEKETIHVQTKETLEWHTTSNNHIALLKREIMCCSCDRQTSDHITRVNI